MKCISLFAALVALFATSASAFTTTVAFRPASVSVPVAAPRVRNTQLNAVIVDQAIADMMAKSDPVGAVIMMFLAISAWELLTPGRAKDYQTPYWARKD